MATLPKSALATWPKPPRPVPMIIMFGTVDPIVRYEGTAQSLSADATVAHWQQVNECAAESEKWDLPHRDPKDGTRVHAERWEGKAPIVFYQLEGHGHGWPMSQDRSGATGPKTRDISAPEEFWKFFKSTDTKL